MSKQKKDKPVYGTYVSSKNPSVLQKAQKLRLIFMYFSILTLAVILFLPQEWSEFTKDILWLQIIYAVFIIALIVVSVITSYGATRKCNVSKPISEKYRPAAGFEKHTFSSVEWFMNLRFLHAAFQLGIVIYGFVNYGFKPWDFVSTVLAITGAVLAFLFRLVTYRALKEDLSYAPPPTAEKESSASTEETTQPNV